ncbi:MAG: hypothetical protein MK116_07105 [Phycisphaerales bacterium]|nr:hypothetical protein [Phycisphaerales bacterium]
MKQLLTVLFVVGTMCFAGGCKTTENACSCVDCKCPPPCQCGQPEPRLGMMNDACPISGRALPENCATSQWKGNAIGFCCNGCKSKFDTMDASGKDDFISEMNSGGA